MGEHVQNTYLTTHTQGSSIIGWDLRIHHGDLSLDVTWPDLAGWSDLTTHAPTDSGPAWAARLASWLPPSWAQYAGAWAETVRDAFTAA